MLPEASARWRQILHALTGAAQVIQPDVRAGVAAARAQLAKELAKRGGDPDLHISAIGHAHMVLAWLWPTRETMRKRCVSIDQQCGDYNDSQDDC